MVQGDVRDVALFNYPSCTDSIKPSLQCLCNFIVIKASEDHMHLSRFYTAQQQV
jgi:hypothetical protein